MACFDALEHWQSKQARGLLTAPHVCPYTCYHQTVRLLILSRAFFYVRISEAVPIMQVTNVTDKSVALDTGAAVPYDYLVLAPGSTYLEPAIKSFAGTPCRAEGCGSGDAL